MEAKLSIFQRSFQTGEILKASGITNTALQNYLRRGIVVGHKDIKGGGGSGTGRYRQYTFRNVMEIALAKAIMDAAQGNIPETAFQAAQIVAHFGEDGRLPGLPLPASRGFTILAVAGEQVVIEAWEPGKDILAILRNELRGHAGFILVNVNDVFRGVCSALDLDPGEILRDAYGE